MWYSSAFLISITLHIVHSTRTSCHIGSRLFFSSTIQLLYLCIENCWKCIQKSLILGFNSPVRPYFDCYRQLRKKWHHLYHFLHYSCHMWNPFLYCPCKNLLTLTYYNNDQIGCWLSLHWIHFELLVIVKLVSEVSTTKTSACKFLRAIISFFGILQEKSQIIWRVSKYRTNHIIRQLTLICSATDNSGFVVKLQHFSQAFHFV